MLRALTANNKNMDETKQSGTNPDTIERDTIAVRPSRHTKPEKKRDIVFYIRQVLNILFMLTAIVGALMYSGVFGEGVQTRQGIIVIIIAVSIKMAECMLRFKK